MTHLVCTKVDKMISPVILAWPNLTWFVNTSWITNLLVAAEPTQDDKSQLCPLETNTTINFPNPARYPAEIGLPQYADLTTIVPDPARATLFQGITVWAWEYVSRAASGPTL